MNPVCRTAPTTPARSRAPAWDSPRVKGPSDGAAATRHLLSGQWWESPRLPATAPSWWPGPARPRQAPPGPTRARQALGTSLWAQAPSTPSRPLQHSRGRPISPAMALARLPSWTPEGACAEGLVAGGAAGGTQGHEWGLAGLFTFF